MAENCRTILLLKIVVLPKKLKVGITEKIAEQPKIFKKAKMISR